MRLFWAAEDKDADRRPGAGARGHEDGGDVIETDRDEEREQRNGVQVLARAATILRLLAADSSGGLTFSELVARSGLRSFAPPGVKSSVRRFFLSAV